jgi:uncharacterized membrane protein YraQ (UPF0718 family)
MKPYARRYLFALGVGLLYGFLWLISPEKILLALTISMRTFGILLVPLGLVLVLMVVLNLSLKSSQIVRYLGNDAGLRGVVLCVAAGVISFGPIYAWYPLLKEMRQRGAGPRTMSIFLGCRAVKPFLLPIMISYFGLIYVMVLTGFTILGSVAVGFLVDAFCKGETRLWGGTRSRRGPQ